jgi:hypothetical protein
MIPRRTFWIFASLLALLVAGFAAQFVFQIGRAPSADTLPVDVVPAVLAGVVIKDLPVAETESVSKAVEEGLGFSDYRYREYRKGGVQFTVYLAYWQDRKRHFMDLGTHAPDNCWVSNGWTMEPKLPKRAFAVQKGAKDRDLGAVRLTWPAENRVFQAGGNTIYVVYWHLLEGKPLDYTRYGTGKTVGYLMDNVGYYWRGTAEQYFLRISSNLPMEELEKQSAFQEVLASLAKATPLVGR